MPAAVPPAKEPANEPDGAPRIATLDILRGIAILAILFMNISEMGASMTANWSDLHHLGWSASDRIVWWLRTILIEGTPRAMLQIMESAGFRLGVIQTVTCSASRACGLSAHMNGGAVRSLFFKLGGSASDVHDQQDEWVRSWEVPRDWTRDVQGDEFAPLQQHPQPTRGRG